MADNFRVLNQRPTTTTVDGVFQPAMLVTFTDDKGFTGDVALSMKTYTPDAVKAAIEAVLSKVNAVKNL